MKKIKGDAMTLEELAKKHCDFEYGRVGEFKFTLDQLRALITEAVGIVQGEVYGSAFNGHTRMNDIPLHHNDMSRLG